jgi:serine/threonine-protein kinase
VGFGSTQATCSGRTGITVDVQVSSDGAAAGTLVLEWYGATSPTGARTVVDTQSIVLAKGATTVSSRYSYSFSGATQSDYWGVAVSTQPAAATGNGSSEYLFGPTCEIQ